MRTKLFITLFSVLFIAGCVPSLHQLWTEDTLGYDEAFVGRFKERENVWQFTADPNEMSYEVVITEKEGKESRLTAHLVKVDGRFFFDFYPSDDAEVECGDWLKFHILGVHLFFKVEKTDNGFSLAAMNPGEIGNFLKRKPDLVKHEVVEDDRVVLTGTPENLQKFLLEGLKIEKFFGDPAVLTPIREVIVEQP